MPGPPRQITRQPGQPPEIRDNIRDFPDPAKSLGSVLAIGVAVGMFVMITLLPALMVTFPRGVFWPYRPTYGSAEPTHRGMWARVGWRIAPRPRITWITTAVILGVLALGLTGLKASGLTNAQGFRGHPDSVVGESVLGEHFPAGAGVPVIVIGNPSAAAALRSAFAHTPGIASVTPPTVRGGYAYLEGTLTAPPDSQAGVRHDRPGAGRGARRPRRQRPGRRRHGRQPRRSTRVRARP